MSARVLIAGAAAATLVASPASASVLRDGIDQRDVTGMKQEVVDLLEKGEALGMAGDFQQAATTFARAAELAPWSSLLRRRECEALTPLGKRVEATVACTHATAGMQTITNLRALGRAMLDGPTAPGPDQLMDSLSVISMESHRSPGGLVPAAISCDVAATLGDGAMLQKCSEELERIAPDDPETRRARALLESRCPPGRFWGGWLAILAAAALTFGDAARRRLARPGRRRALAGATALLAVVAATGVAHADPETEPPHGWLSKWDIDDANPSAAIPTEKDRNADPLQFGYWLQDLALKAERATKKGDHAAAVRFYEALVRAVPDRSIGYSKSCDEYEAMGELAKATNACAAALTHDGVRLGDYTHFVHLVLQRPGSLSDKETTAVDAVVRHMKEDASAGEATADLECEVGVRTSNVAYLKECTTSMAARAPDAAKTVTYQWALAIQEGKFDEARTLVERASTLGVAVDAMKQTTDAGEKKHRLYLFAGLGGAALLLVAALYAGVLGMRRRPTPKAA